MSGLWERDFPEENPFPSVLVYSMGKKFAEIHKEKWVNKASSKKQLTIKLKAAPGGGTRSRNANPQPGWCLKNCLSGFEFLHFFKRSQRSQTLFFDLTHALFR
jgi:hypothetical protein